MTVYIFFFQITLFLWYSYDEISYKICFKGLKKSRTLPVSKHGEY